MKQKILEPILDEDEWGVLRRVDVMTPQLAEEYGKTPLANAACRRLLSGFESFIEPLRELAPRSWAVLSRHCADAYLIESLDRRETGLEPGRISPVFPVPAGFCSFGLYFGLSPDPFGDESYLADFERKIARLPECIRNIVRYFKQIYVNSESEYLELPDVTALRTVPHFGTSIKEFVAGSRKKALRAQFGDLTDIPVIARQRASEAWCLFFDNSEKGDGALWLAVDPHFKEVRKLVKPEQAFDAMLEHYLTGSAGEFDFSAF